MESPYNRLAKDKLTLSFARLLCKSKTTRKGAAESLPDLMQPVEMELDLHLIPLYYCGMKTTKTSPRLDRLTFS
jgi:hypothetical protein